MTQHSNAAVPEVEAGEIPDEPASSTPTYATATDKIRADGNSFAAGMVNIDGASTAHFWIGHGPDGDDRDGKTQPRIWSDRSRVRKLGQGLGDDLDKATRAKWDAFLIKHRLLIVDCVDSQVQQDAADSILMETLFDFPVRFASVFGDPVDSYAKPGRPTSDDEDGPFTHADIVHPKLADGAPSVLFVELQGACGQALLDRVCTTQGMFETFSSQLKQLKRYVVFLPRGNVRTALLGSTASRGFHLRIFSVEFLQPWLKRYFPAEVDACSDAIEELMRNGAWGGSEEQLYEWLSGSGQRGAGKSLLDRLKTGVEGPAAVRTTELALENDDGASEPLLAALFVASNLQKLKEAEFCAAVEQLLGDRTRLRKLANDQEQEVQLVTEWRTGLRAIMRKADLEVRSSASGPRVVGFKDPRASSMVQAMLADAPMFAAEQLDRLLAAGLLFDVTSQQLSVGVAELVAKVRADEPDRYDANWLFPYLAHALAPQERIQVVVERVQLLGLLILFDLLQRAHERSAEPRRASIVNELLDRALRSDAPYAALLVPRLADLLRGVPGFDCWHWLRQVVERGNQEARERAESVLKDLPLDAEPECLSDLDELLAWLTEAKDGSAAKATAAKVMAGLVTHSLRCGVHGERSRSYSVGEAFHRYAQWRPDSAGKLVDGLLHPLVTTTLLSMEHAPSDALRVLLPREAWRADMGPWLPEWLERLSPAWNAAVSRLVLAARVADPHVTLVPAIALHAWCWRFRDTPAVLETIGQHVQARHKHLRAGLRSWFSVFVELAGTSSAQLASSTLLPRADRQQILPAAKARRTQLEAFRTRLLEGGAQSTEVVP